MKRQIIALAIIFAVISPAAVMAETSSINEQIIALQAQIAVLQAQIKAMQASESGSQVPEYNPRVSDNWCHTFEKNMGIGASGEEVLALAIALQKAGFPNVEIYDGTTELNYSQFIAGAVARFQEKYIADILSKAGLTRGTGYLGLSTRNALNRLYGCKRVSETPRSNNAVTVVSPNGGETWTIGSTQLVTWKNDSKYLVSITLVSDCADTACRATLSLPREYLLATNVSNITQENYSWTVGKTFDGHDGPSIPVGSYTIKICNTLTNVCDKSDSYFKIVDSTPTTQVLRVLTPNGGETWTRDSTQAITFAGVTRPVEIWLMPYPQVVCSSVKDPCPVSRYQLVSGVPAYSSYSWRVGESVSNEYIPAGSYQIQVCEVNVGSFGQCDKSDSYFKIVNPGTVSPLTVLSPNGGESWVTSTTITSDTCSNSKINCQRITWSGGSGAESRSVVAYLERLVNGKYEVLGKLPAFGWGSILWPVGIVYPLDCDTTQFSSLYNCRQSIVSPGLYYVRVVDSTTGAWDRSDTDFKVGEPSLEGTVSVASAIVEPRLVVAGARSALVGAYSVTNTGVPVRVVSMKFQTIQKGSGNQLSDYTNFVIKDVNGNVLAGPVNLQPDFTEDTVFNPWLLFNDAITYPIGSGKYFIYANVSPSVTGGNTIYMKTYPSTGWPAYDAVSGTGAVITVTPSEVAMGVVTVGTVTSSAGTVNVVLSPVSPIVGLIPTNSINTRVLELKLTATLESFVLKSLSLQYDGSDNNSITKVTLWDGPTKIGETQLVGSSKLLTFYPTATITIPKNSDKFLIVKADIGNTPGAIVKFSYDGDGNSSAVGMESGITVKLSSSDVSGYPLTVSSTIASASPCLLAQTATPVTRGNAACAIVTIGKVSTDIFLPPQFTDVLASDPNFKYINTLYNAGITTGCATGKFCPLSNLTRGEAIVLIVRAKGYALVNPAVPRFSDVPTTHAYYKFIETAAAKGLVVGNVSGQFMPSDAITSGDLSAVLSKAFFIPVQNYM